MQAVSDIFLGWQSATPPGRRAADYYFRQLRDWKYSAEIERMNAAAMTGYGRLCGWTLARAHARTGDRIAIAAYLGGSDTSTRPWPDSPRPTLIRPNATTRHWLTRLPPGASKPRRTPEPRPWTGQAPDGHPEGGGDSFLLSRVRHAICLAVYATPFA